MECGMNHTSTDSEVIMCIVTQRVNGYKLKSTSAPIKFCAAKQRIKVLKDGIRIDHRRLQKLEEKITMGQKKDHHEEQTQGQTMATG